MTTSSRNVDRPQHELGSAEASRTVKHTLAEFETKITHYPEKAREPAAYIFQFMHERCNGSPALVAEVLRKIMPVEYRDREQYVYQVTTGRYFRSAAGAQAVENLKEMADRLRQWDMLEQQRGRVPFNENLTNWRLVRDYIDRKRARGAVCKFGAIQGETGDGKTACTRHYQLLNNHLTTVRLEAPSKPSLPRFLMKLGRCYNIPYSLGTGERLASIDDNVNDTRTIIIENVQKLYSKLAGPNQPVFNYLQELQDDTGCTIIVTWTPTFRDEITSGKDSLYFRQFVSRLGGIEDVLVLPRPKKRDLLAIVEQWEIQDEKAALPILAEWSRLPGTYRLICERLQKAKLIAGKKPLGVHHLEQVATVAISDLDKDEEAA